MIDGNILKAFAARLMMARIEAKMTQKELGEKSGLGAPLYVLYENGQAKPTKYHLSKIADALGKHVNLLIYFLDGKMYPEGLFAEEEMKNGKEKQRPEEKIKEEVKEEITSEKSSECQEGRSHIVAFGKCLKELRHKAQLDRVDLGEKTGLGSPLIAYYESGLGCPTDEDLEKLTTALECPKGYLKSCLVALAKHEAERVELTEYKNISNELNNWLLSNYKQPEKGPDVEGRYKEFFDKLKMLIKDFD